MCSVQKDSGSPLLCKKVKHRSNNYNDISESLYNPNDNEQETKIQMEAGYYLVGM